jgi:hypothetical protein
MSPYRIALVAFWLPVVIFLGIIAFLCASPKMPAPHVSSSYAFNQKALWLRSALQREPKIDVLIVGSSMGLNNVNGEELSRILGTNRIVNASSWGMSLPITWHLTKELLNRTSPRLVILPVYFGDFQTSHMEEPDWSGFNALLSSWSELLPYLENPEGNYYREHYGDELKPGTRERQTYYGLNFDVYGGVPLNPDHFQTNPSRWDIYQRQELTAVPSDEALSALKEMTAALRESRTAFLVVACPMRQPAEEKFAVAAQKMLWDKVAPIVEDGGVFVHIPGGPDFDDSLFVDSYHLNAHGGKKLADLLAPTLKKLYPEP